MSDIDPQQFGEIKAEVRRLADLQKEHRTEHRDDHKIIEGKLDKARAELTDKFDAHREESLSRHDKLKWMVVASTITTGGISLFDAEVKDVIIALFNSLVNSAQAFL